MPRVHHEAHRVLDFDGASRRADEARRFVRRAAAAAWLLAIGVLFALPARSADLPSELATVGEVRFEGRKHVSGKELRAAVKTRPSSLLFSKERPLLRLDYLRADTASIENIYHQHGYLDARATWRTTPLEPSKKDAPSAAAPVIVTFTITEGPRTKIRAVEFEGVHAITLDQVRKPLFAKPGKPFNPFFLIADTAKIAELYKDRGYFPEVRGDTVRAERDVTVRYVIDEGPRRFFGPVTLVNPEALTVSEPFVRRELVVRPGEVFRVSRVQQSVERLYETGVFRQVSMDPSFDSTGTIVSFDLTLGERKPRWVDAGIGSGTTERLITTGQWGHRNLFSRGMLGAFTGRLALDQDAHFLLSRLEASLLEPWLFGSRTRALTTLYFENRHDRTPQQITETRSQGISEQLTRQLGRYTRLLLTQDNTHVVQNQTFIDPNLPDSIKILLSQDIHPKFTVHRLLLGVDRETRDHPILMTRGSFQSISGEVAGGPLQGAPNFTKGHFSSSWYSPVRPGWILATRIRAGDINPFGAPGQFSVAVPQDVASVPFNDRFRLGGVNTIRGYNENYIPFRNGQSRGGLVLLQWNAELRVDVLGPLGLEFYVDAGNVWDNPSEVSQGSFSPAISSDRMTPLDVRWVYGFGPRFQLPFGPLRLDFTWWARPDETGKRQRGTFQFAIGPSF